MKKLSTEEFIIRSNKIHCYFYDYSEVKYKGMHKKIKIICPIHGIFETTPNIHIIKKCKCFKCKKDEEKINKENFEIRSNEIHNNKYDYSLVKYINNKIEIKIICPIHGIFEQIPNNHLRGFGCPNCKYDKKKLDKDEFIRRSNEVHNNKFDYSKIKYEDLSSIVEIICPIHGKFRQKSSNHISGNGCTKCKISKGEKEISKILDKYSIIYEQQKKFNDCKYKYNLRFDFYIEKYNLCIEYQGKQHYESIKYWGGEKGFELRKERDRIKKDFCKNNNINLLIIKYDEDIKLKLKSQFN